MELTGIKLNHCMLRIKDPGMSLEFYTKVLGAHLIEQFTFDSMGFTLYFLGFESGFESKMPTNRDDRIVWLANQSGLLELTHNHGTETDNDFSGYHDGNTEPKGFGHICISVPDVYATCEHLEQKGIEFIKKPEGGSMKGIAFVKDPDGYWIEIFSPIDLKNVVLANT